MVLSEGPRPVIFSHAPEGKVRYEQLLSVHIKGSTTSCSSLSTQEDSDSGIVSDKKQDSSSPLMNSFKVPTECYTIKKNNDHLPDPALCFKYTTLL